LKDASRRVRKLRRKIYRRTSVKTRNPVAKFDPSGSDLDFAAILDRGHLGISSASSALALWRSCNDLGLRVWCYNFGFPASLTHTVTVVEVEGVLQVHDPFFNLSYTRPFHEVLDSLRGGIPLNPEHEIRDRKIYEMDPAVELKPAVQWLESHAEREIDSADGLRRFELLWNLDAFVATSPAIEAAFRDLEARGYPRDLRYLMLHPIAVFDGAKVHQRRADMPLVGKRDLRSPLALLRVTAREAVVELASERRHSGEKTAAIARLEAELTGAASRVSAALDEVGRLRGDIAQITAARDEAARGFAAERDALSRQKLAFQVGRAGLEAEVAEARSRLVQLADAASQKESQVAQLRAAFDDATASGVVLQSEMLQWRASLDRRRAEWDAARLVLENENRDLKMRLAAGTAERDQLRSRTAAAESRVIELDEQTIALTHYLAQLVDHGDRSREAQTAAPLGKPMPLWRSKSSVAGLGSYWRRWATNWTKRLRG
jgi:hypothetical protein